MHTADLKSFLDEKTYYYNQPVFIETDPLQIPHQFSVKEDIEIAGLLSATIAWGNRKMIIQNAQRMMNLMGNSPYDFVLSHQEKDLKPLESFVHRTFNGVDLNIIYQALQLQYFGFHLGPGFSQLCLALNDLRLAGLFFLIDILLP